MMKKRAVKKKMVKRQMQINNQKQKSESEKTKPKLLVIALGGNALIKKGQIGTDSEQLENLSQVCNGVVGLIKKGYKLILTHGNGPQVGNILLQQEAPDQKTAKMKLDTCVAESQGQIGYFIQQALQKELAIAGIRKNVITVVTRVVVDKNDPAFKNPTKPIGPFYDKETAQHLSQSSEKQIINDSNRGWRRVVPSPEPKEIVELTEIKKLLENDCVIVCCGGGGIPVVKNTDGTYFGTEAVIDKDLAAELLASKTNADLLLILTDVKKVAINFGTETQTNLDKLNVKEARAYLAEGQFASGSMGPKIEAAIRFAQSGRDRKTIIAALDELENAIDEKECTVIQA